MIHPLKEHPSAELVAHNSTTQELSYMNEEFIVKKGERLQASEKKKNLELSLNQLRKNYKELEQQIIILDDRIDAIQKEVDKIQRLSMTSLEEAIQSK